METQSEWYSERRRREDLRLEQLKISDDFLDLVLEGVITHEQARIGYNEICETAKEIGVEHGKVA